MVSAEVTNKVKGQVQHPPRAVGNQEVTDAGTQTWGKSVTSE